MKILNKLVIVIIISFGQFILNQNLIIGQNNVDSTQFSVDMKHVNGSIYMIRTETKIGNPTLAVSIGDDGIFLFDNTFSSLISKEILNKLSKIISGKVKYVVNSHWHGDHSGSNSFFGENGAIIIATEETRDFLSSRGLPEVDEKVLTKPGWPSLTIKDSISIYFNEEKIKVIALPNPGHTSGDMITYFENSDVLCVGDYFIPGKFPAIDMDGSYNGGDLEGYIYNMNFMINRFSTETHIIVGHPPFKPSPLQSFKVSDMANWFTQVMMIFDTVKIKVQNGKTRDEVLSEGLPIEFDDWQKRPRYINRNYLLGQLYDYYDTKKQANLILRK
jgi:cyclase